MAVSVKLLRIDAALAAPDTEALARSMRKLLGLLHGDDRRFRWRATWLSPGRSRLLLRPAFTGLALPEGAAISWNEAMPVPAFLCTRGLVETVALLVDFQTRFKVAGRERSERSGRTDDE